jgi:hypothetical protein
MSVSLVPSHARWSFPAGSSNLQQFQFVALNASGQIVTPAATGVYAMVLDDAPALAGSTIVNDMPTGGFTVGVYYGCVAPMGCFQKVITGAALTPGTAVMTDTNGHAVAAVTGAVVLGFTIASSNAGDIAVIALNSGGYHN